MTRFGVHALVERLAVKAQADMPSLANKPSAPIAFDAWLGHVSLDTTNIYAEIDLEGKAKALAKCDITNEVATKKRWLKNPDLMEFLRSL